MKDVIVIGAGGGGAVVAKELAARGLDVLMLEAGAAHTNPEQEFSRLEVDANNPLSGYFRFGPANRSKPAFRRELPQLSAISQVSGVGGTTQHYYGNSPRAMPGTFLGYSGSDTNAYNTNYLFPFSYKELIPYYQWVEETLPVQTAPMGRKELAFFLGAEKMGLPFQNTKDIAHAAFRPQENAILQPRGNAGKTTDPAKLQFPLASGCTFCGHCFQGCIIPRRAPRNLKAKRSTDNSYMPMALTADLWANRGKPVTLISDAFATRIHTDNNSVARAVTWRIGATGESATEEAHVIVMACGAIETPRLWLMSGLPNPNGWVGRGLTDHFLDVIVGLMPFDIGASKGPGSAARADFPGYGSIEICSVSPAFLAASLANSDAGMAGLYDNAFGGSRYEADTMGRIIGADMKNLLAQLDHVMYLGIMTDDDVEAQNRITLSTTQPPDEHGQIPRIEIHHRNRSERTIRNREYLAKQAIQLLRKAGATTVHRIAYPPYMFHPHSTMRMGLNEADSILDANAEARWVKRLFVADNSALANSLGGPNPTLTTQALATRTAEKIFQLYFEGEPWINKEKPVPSIDSTVTQAVIARNL